MTLEEFSILDTQFKWIHIKQVMDYISQMDVHYNLRKRYNAHHEEIQRKQEERNLRLDQVQRWGHIKDLYAAHRDELNNTLDNQEFQECKSIIERVFTLELDDALRNVIED